jgi:hypothetical protein
MQFWHADDPTLPRQSAHRWRWGREPYTLAALYSTEKIFFLFLLLISVRWDHMVLADHLISHPSMDTSAIWTAILAAEVSKLQLEPV